MYASVSRGRTLFLMIAAAALAVLVAPGVGQSQGTSVSATPPVALVVGGFTDIGATLREAVLDNWLHATIKISDQSLLQVGWTVQVDSEQMEITGLTEGNPDTMTVIRGVNGTAVASHSEGRPIGGPIGHAEIRANNITESDGLGAYQFKVTWNASLATLVKYDITPGISFLESGGRQVFGCIGPTVTDGSFLFGCSTWDPQYPGGGGRPGPTGSHLLATLTFAHKETIGTSTLTLDSGQTYLLDPPGNVIPALLINSSIIVPTCGDFNHDGGVWATDVILMRAHFGTQSGEPNWDPIYDLDQNGSVYVSDVIALRAEFGLECTIV
jgi:hypothetical protein